MKLGARTSLVELPLGSKKAVQLHHRGGQRQLHFETAHFYTIPSPMAGEGSERKDGVCRGVEDCVVLPCPHRICPKIGQANTILYHAKI